MRKSIQELFIGDYVLYAGKTWKVVGVSKVKSSLFNVELYCKETSEKTTLRKIPGAVGLEVL